MYLEYYSLDRPPFRITPDPSLFYTGGVNGRGVVLEALLYAISSGEGILKVVGEVGSGKTMLCRMLEERLPDSVEMVYLANPNLSPHDILYAIAFELKLPVDHSTQRLVLMQHLQEYLLQQHAANKSVLVIIEEAQSMPLETLEEVRLFSNLETHQHKLMQIVLFGQPELDRNLQDKSIRQLRERITHSFDLRPLKADEVGDYIRFRLQAAGCPAPQVFSEAAEKLIAKASGGLTRRINILADKAMLAAYAESATGQRPRMIDNSLQPVVHPRHVWEAIKDSGYRPAFWTMPKVAAAGVLAGLLLAVLAWWGLSLVQPAPANAARLDQIGSAPVALPEPAEPAMQEPVAATDPETGESVAVETAVQESLENEPAVPETAAALQDEPIPAQAPAATSPAVPVTARIETVITDPDVEGDSAMAAGTQEIAPAASQAAPALPVEALSTTFPGESSEFPMLAARSEAMRHWLADANPEHYTVQLLSVPSRESTYVNRILSRLDEAGLLGRTYSCISRSGGVDYWKVVYGDYASFEQARLVIGDLPPNIRNNGPYVQSIRRMDCAATGSHE